MKRLIRIIPLLIMLVSSLMVQAYDHYADGIYYNVDAINRVCTVTYGENKYTGDIIIPKEVLFKNVKLPVVAIASDAFFRCAGLTSIVIPASVTTIDSYTFYGCTSLASIEIPNSVTEIGNYAFKYCTSLTSVEIPNSVTTIGESAFNCCTSLTSVEIPNSVTTIGESAFDECNSLISIEIPNSVTTIGKSAFGYCTSLTSVAIPNSVTTIGESAFNECTSLTSVEISNSVTTIDRYTFYGCTSLTSIEIPNSVTAIYVDAFAGCTSLMSITIPNSVTWIGESAFEYCNFKEIVFEPGEEILKMDRNAFSSTSATSFKLGRKISISIRYGEYESNYFPSIIISDWKSSLRYFTFTYPLTNYSIDYAVEGTVRTSRDLSLSGFSLNCLTLDENVREFKATVYDANISEIRSLNLIPPVMLCSFSNDSYLNTVVYVPDEAVEAYKQAPIWKNFWDIRGLGSTAIKGINNGSPKEEGQSIYDMMGRRLNEPQKGINIINGKKILVK